MTDNIVELSVRRTTTTSITIPREAKIYIDYVQTQAHETYVDVNLVNEKGISTNGSSMLCNGYFTDVPTPTLAVAIDKPFAEWFPTFIHESCHMMQWINDAPEWTAANITENIGAMDILDLWMENLIDLSPRQLTKFITLARAVEIDCEKRSVDAIIKFNLSIDVKEYIQRANAYLFFYHIIGKTRRWYKIGREPYNVDVIWKNMPTTFVDDYDTMQQPTVEEYWKLVI